MSRRRALASVLCLGILLTGLTADARRLRLRDWISSRGDVAAKPERTGLEHLSEKDMARVKAELEAASGDRALQEQIWREAKYGIPREREPRREPGLDDLDDVATPEREPLESSIWEREPLESSIWEREPLESSIWAPEPPLPGGARSFSELSSLPASTSPATPPDLASRGFLEHALRDVPAPAVRQVDGERARRREVEETEPWPGKLYRPCSEGGQGQSGSASRHGQGRAAATGC